MDFIPKGGLIMKKFELTAENKLNWLGHELYRIRALLAFETTNGEKIDIGDLGGYVESEKNLSHDEKAWIYGDAEVFGNAKIFGNAKVCGDAEVYGNAKVYGDAEVWGDAKVFGDVECRNRGKEFNSELVSEDGVSTKNKYAR